MTRRLISFFLFLLSVVGAYAQRAAGRVVDAETRKPLAMATCKLVNRNDSIIRYCITGRDGKFSLDITPKTAELVVSYIGYKSRRMDIKSASADMSVELERAEQSLQEVFVKAPPIVRRKDTLNYNVASFAGKGDKYLEDVLKKLPGIEVMENGNIKYQGKPIGRFNIEGQSLLGGKYNQATRNMPYEAVATVQVLENNQPVRALENKIFSDQTTLNIKLKKGYKSRLFGEGVVGVGGFDKFLWDNKLTAINVSPKQQTLFSLEMNNHGKSLAGLMLDHLDFSNIQSLHPVPTGLLDDITLRMLPIKSKRYLDNRSYSAGFNHLFVLSEYSSLIVNLSYINERETSQDSTFWEYGGESVFRLAEANHLKKRHHNLSPSLKYELNAPKLFLEDELKTSFSKTEMENRLTSNGTPLDNTQKKRPDYIQNNLKMIINAKKNVYTLHSFTRYFTDKEELISPFAELLHHRQLLMENSLTTNVPLFGRRWSCTYFNEYLKEDFRLADDWETNTILTHTLTTSISQNAGRFRISATLPFNFSHISIPWKQENNEHRFHVSPSVSLGYTPTSLFLINVSGSYKETTDEQTLMSQPYYSNYRSIYQPLDKMGWQKRWNAGFTMSYHSVLHLMSWYFLANASWTKSDHYFEYTYDAEATVRRPVWEDNSQRLFYATTSFQKTFAKGVSMKSSLNFSRMEMLLAQNGRKDIYKSNALSATVDFIYSALSWMNMSYAVTGNLSWHDKESNTRLKSLYDDLSISFFPFKKVAVNLSLEHNAIEISKGTYKSNVFWDMSLDYNLSKRVKIRVLSTNLLNQKNYINASYSAFNYNYFSKPIRGREFILYLQISF